MSVEENKAIVRRYYESTGREEAASQIRQAADPAAEAAKILKVTFAETYAPGAAIHYPEGDRAIEDDIGFNAMMACAFPDMKAIIDDMIGEGDKVVTCFTVHGTHEGPVMGIPATGKKVSMKGVSIKRLSGGKVVEEWWLGDMLGLMQQLGVIPGNRKGEK
jgi:predicted ester cyclase